MAGSMMRRETAAAKIQAMGVPSERNENVGFYFPKLKLLNWKDDSGNRGICQHRNENT